MTFSNLLSDYLNMRRSLGWQLKRDGKALAHFVVFLQSKNADYITAKLSLEWAHERSLSQPSSWAQRLRYVRGFAKYCNALDPRTEVPSATLLPHRAKRARPYIYTSAEVTLLLQAALELAGSDWKRLTYHYLLGLLAITGLRLSEAINLKLEDLDLETGILRIENTKFGKSRLLPLHASTQKALAEYIHYRNEFLRGKKSNHFFLSMASGPLDQGTIRRTFYVLSRKIGIRAEDASHGPRLHDFRHQFAVKTLMIWYQAGDDVERRLPVLSTYLGHAHVSDTYWYVSAYPELMDKALRRLEQHWEEI